MRTNGDRPHSPRARKLGTIASGVLSIIERVLPGLVTHTGLVDEVDVILLIVDRRSDTSVGFKVDPHVGQTLTPDEARARLRRGIELALEQMGQGGQ